MKAIHVFASACAILACAVALGIQGNSGHGSHKKPSAVNSGKHKGQLRKSNSTSGKGHLSRDGKHMRHNEWCDDEDKRFRRELKLTSSQGRRISAINRQARDRILAAQRSGLRGQALARKISQIRADARRQIERVLTSRQRKAWDWIAWERRWDAHWDDD
jgi:hypothetical protein